MVSHKVGVHIQPVGCRALLGTLYLFSSYALRCQLSFRNIVDYLGITLLSFRFHRFYPIYARLWLLSSTELQVIKHRIILLRKSRVCRLNTRYICAKRICIVAHIAYCSVSIAYGFLSVAAKPCDK